MSATYVPYLVTENLCMMSYFSAHVMTSLSNGLLQDIAIFMYEVNFQLQPKNILALLSDSPSDYSVRKTECFICRLI